MKLKFIMKTMLMIALFCLPLALTSCDDDEDEIVNVNYSIGFDEVHASDLSEMGKIENVFKQALGVQNSEFVYTGTLSECDQKVINACKKAEADIALMDIKGSYKVVILNYNTAKYVFTCKIPQE